jgi:hypothetical protein
MHGVAPRYDRRLDESHFAPRKRSGVDGHLRLAIFCTVVAWLLALMRFYVALTRGEHGLDAMLAGVLSAALPGIGGAAAANAYVRHRRSTGSSDNNVVLLRKGDHR